MSSVYLEDTATGSILSDQQLAAKAKLDISRARSYRKRFEPTWKQNLAMAAGQHWLEINRYNRALQLPDEYQDKELYTADVITEYRQTALGEIGGDDDRPELLLAKQDVPSEDYTKQINRALRFGWDHEWDGDQALEEADRLCIDLGTSAIRCRFDPDTGPSMGEYPHVNGQPVLDPEQQTKLLGNGPNPDVQMKQIQQGKICWEPGSAFNFLVPPGVPHERYFPWECWVRPVLLSDVKAEYGEPAADLTEDGDIGSLLGEESVGGGDWSSTSPGNSGAGRLHGYIWLFTYYVRPSKQNPQGQVITLGSNQMKLLKVDQRLPYQGPNGEWRSGIVYFHWWRVSGRFWSRGLMDVMKDIQRGINRRRTQSGEIVDRGMPFWFVEKDSNVINDANGKPMGFAELGAQERQPVPHPGIGPGTWMQADVEAMREDLAHATGIHGIRIGEAALKSKTYGELALENENDQTKRSTILAGRQRSIFRLVEDSVYDIGLYWGPQKRIALAGDNDLVDVEVFDATKVPAFFIVRAPKGVPKPRSQAAELKKVEDVAQFSVQARTPVPVKWLLESLDAGQALPLPEAPTDAQAELVAMENHMLLQGVPQKVDYSDIPATHIPGHRGAQIQARLQGRVDLVDGIEQHIQDHMHMAALVADSLPQAPPVPPPEPPGGPAALPPGGPP
jgi:hypothetical protein